MNKTKLTGIAMATAFAMVFSAPLALAQTNDTSVINSGDDASISSSSNSSSQIDVSNNNSASINQAVDAHVNTGGNQASENISLGGGGSSITTGAAAALVDLNVAANQNTTSIGGMGGGNSMNSTDVVNTGDNANVWSNLTNNTRVDVSNRNNADINQYVSGNVNTGENNANENIGGGTINTGRASVGVSLDALVNDNRTAISGLSNTSGLVNDTVITNTGDDADINSSASSYSSTRVNNTNNMWVDQFVHGGANTGYNDADENIGGGGIVSGPAQFLVSLGVTGNQNRTGIGMSSLSPLSFNTNDIVNTGDDIDVNTNVDTNTHVKVYNSNYLSSNQSMHTWSSSGDNRANENIGHSGIWSNGAAAGVNFDVLGNHNDTLFGGMLSALMSWF